MGDFDKDILRGSAIEDEILAILLKAFPSAKKSPPKTSGYDIILFGPSSDPLKHNVITIEVKADLYDSPNFAFEFEGRYGQLTGILATEAKYWIQYRKGFYHVWETKILRDFLTFPLRDRFVRRCGDHKASKAWVVPQHYVLTECPPVASIPRGSAKLNEVIK